MSIDVNHTSGKISTADKDLKLQAVNQPGDDYNAVSYTHLTLPTTPYV